VVNCFFFAKRERDGIDFSWVVQLGRRAIGGLVEK
jgi:hypothetical protein